MFCVTRDRYFVFCVEIADEPSDASLRQREGLKVRRLISQEKADDEISLV
jgi:hypothetical protein